MMPKQNEPIKAVEPVCICKHYHAEDGTCGLYDSLGMGMNNARHMSQHVECMVGCYEAADDYHQFDFGVPCWADSIFIPLIERTLELIENE